MHAVSVHAPKIDRRPVRIPRGLGGSASVPLAIACLAVLAVTCPAHAQSGDDAARLRLLERQVAEQGQRLDTLENAVTARDRQIANLQSALDASAMGDMRARGTPQVTTPSPQTAQLAPQQVDSLDRSDSDLVTQRPDQPVGRAPDPRENAPEVARIFDQPTVLTRKGGFVLEPSFQFGYSSNDRVALIGYTVVPAILIGLIDVRQVKTTSATAAMTARYGVSRRLELEARVPYVYTGTDTISREVFTGSAQDRVFEADGRGLGDVEIAARYQLSNNSAEKPFYVGWLRYKSRTGRDPFEVVTDCVQRCIGNTTGTGLPLELPTGSGFDALQGGVTWLKVSDPAVFFGSFSYLHNFTRDNVSRRVIDGSELIGDVDAGDVYGFNVGMGLALNEKASISLGYDQSIVTRMQQNGRDIPGSVRLVLGTLLVGASYRFSDRISSNFSLGVGVTRDTPDLTLTMRTPIAF